MILMKHSLAASHKLAYRNVSNTRSWHGEQSRKH